MIIAAAALVSLLSGCATSYYRVPDSYKGFRADDDIASSTQQIAYRGDDEAMVNTYDDEFFYDEDGNLIKHVQTEYFNYGEEEPHFYEWETNYVKIGDYVVPSTISVNGIEFAKVEYEILAVESEGIFRPGISAPYFQYVTTSMFSKDTVQSWSAYRPSVSEFSIGFPDDGRFVEEIDTFSQYSGYGSKNVLTMGYDNVVLTRLKYSYERLTDGLALSNVGYNPYSANLQKVTRGSNVNFNYEWEIIAGKICATALTYDLTVQNTELTFSSEMEYDDSGRRINEIWTVIDPQMEKKEMDAFVLFEQELTY